MIRPLGRHALDFFQIWNQKICEGKKKNKQTNWEEEDDKVGAVRSWNSKLATKHRSPASAFIFVSFLLFLLFSFFFPWRLLWFLTFSQFGFVLNSFFLFYVSNSIGSRDLPWKNLEPISSPTRDYLEESRAHLLHVTWKNPEALQLHVTWHWNKKTSDFWNWQNVPANRFATWRL